MLLGLEGFCYKQRLDRLDLYFLERRLKGDPIEIYKIMEGLVKVGRSQWFDARERWFSDKRKMYFTQNG